MLRSGRRCCLRDAAAAPDQVRELCLPDLNRVASQISAVELQQVERVQEGQPSISALPWHLEHSNAVLVAARTVEDTAALLDTASPSIKKHLAQTTSAAFVIAGKRRSSRNRMS